MCAWRIAATLLVTLVWPALTFAWQDDTRRQADVAQSYPYAALQPTAWHSSGFTQTDVGHGDGSSVPTAEIGWPGLTTTVAIHTWGSLRGRWRFASLVDASYALDVGIPPADVDMFHASANPSPATMTMVPVIATYRLGSAYRVAFSWGVIAPVSRRDGNASTVWAMRPKVAYTRVLSASNLDSSTIVAVGTFSRQAVANYQGVAMGRIEALVMHRNPNGWGFGGVAAAIQPTNIMSAPWSGHGPNALDGGGFALGVGPQLNWNTRWLGSGVEFQYRWIYEFRAPNGHTDQPMLLSATVHL
jgi:hypothetical protein